MKHKYTKELLEDKVKESKSMRQLLLSLGLVARGGNFEIMKARLSKFEIDYSHFTGKGWRKGESFKTKKRKLADILTLNSQYRSGSPYQSNAVKKILFRNDLKEKKCENCGITDWLGEEISFELHHIDGNKFNNQINNLKILCPNCHCLTDNYRGKNTTKEGPKGAVHCLENS